jgi:hypothetical protein
VWGRKERVEGLWWGNLKVRNNLEDLGMDKRILLNGL